jgi:hypothetical protein
MRFAEDELRFNEFIVYKIAKGKVSREVDNILSPCFPVIED